MKNNKKKIAVLLASLISVPAMSTEGTIPMPIDSINGIAESPVAIGDGVVPAPEESLFSEDNNVYAQNGAGSAVNQSIETVNPVSESRQRAQIHSSMKGELEVLKLQYQLETVQEQIKAMRERTKSTEYAKQLKKVEAHYEALREKDKLSAQEEQKRMKIRLEREFNRKMAATTKRYEQQIVQLNAALSGAASKEAELRSEIASSKEQKIQEDIKAASLTVDNLDYIYVTRIENLRNSKRAQIFFKNHMMWIEEGETILDGITISHINRDRVSVLHELSGTSKTLPLVTMQYAKMNSFKKSEQNSSDESNGDILPKAQLTSLNAPGPNPLVQSIAPPSF